jgi:Ca2+-binding RTX toxin-like protein
MPSVTISGSSTQSAIALTFDTTANYTLAKQIAAQINAGVKDGSIVTSKNATPPVPPNLSGSYFQTNPGAAFLPAGYTSANINVASFGSAILFDTSGALNQTILSDQNTHLFFSVATGSGTVVAGGGGNELSVGGSGAWSLNTGGGPGNIILATGSGNDTISGGPGSNAIALGSGNDLITSTGDDIITGGAGTETVDATAAKSDLVYGGSSDLLFIGGVGGATVLGGTGSDTYFGAAVGPTGSQYIVGGTAGNNLLFAGDGAATLVGGGSGDQLYAYGSSNQVLIAGSGNETLSAALSSGADSLSAGKGNDQIAGGSGADTFLAGTGNATIAAGAAAGVFEFIKGQAGGTEVVQGLFDGAGFKIDLQGYGPGANAAALASQTVTSSGVTITLNDGTSVTFDNVTSLKGHFI